MIRKFLKLSCPIQFLWLVSLIVFTDITFADPGGPSLSQAIEVFTSAEYPVVETDIKGTGRNFQGPEITVYDINGIQTVERDLSLDLPTVPQRSKPIVLQRIQNLDEPTRSSMQAAATGLAKTMQYRIDRFPAIVFDGRAVVYGVTNVQEAHALYQAWRSGDKP